MLALLGIVLSIGAADSINPSTVAPALYLASGVDAARNLIAFIAGVFFVSAGAGVAVVLGPGQLLLSHRPHPHTEHLVEVVAGLVLVALAAGLWLARKRIARRVVRQERIIGRRSALFGAAIMAAELPTALPYFAVIAAAAGSGRPAMTQVLLILLFNLVFVTPLLAVLAIRQVAGSRGAEWLASIRLQLERRAETLVPALVLVVAVVLVTLGSIGLAGG